MRRLFAALVTTVLAAALATPALAAGPLHVYSGLGFGKVLEDGAPGGGLGINVGLIYQLATSPIGIGAEASYVMLGKEDVLGGEVKTSTIPVTAQLYYMFPSSSGTSAYIDAGGGFYSTEAKFEANVGGQEADASETDAGINFGGGVKFGSATSTIKFGVDGKYHIIMTEDESTNMITLFARVFFG